jgi:hypothetical protein
MNIIDQADKIVFGDARAADKPHNTTLRIGINTYRRGAYIEWLLSKGHDEAAKAAFDDVGLMAERIVALDAAKGDGLPDGLTAKAYSNAVWGDGVVTEKTLGALVRTDDFKQADKVAVYINRCLSAPVRRLLAAFDIVHERDCNHRGFAILRKTDGSPNFTSTDKWIDEETICCIVPKAVKQ